MFILGSSGSAIIIPPPPQSLSLSLCHKIPQNYSFFKQSVLSLQPKLVSEGEDFPLTEAESSTIKSCQNFYFSKCWDQEKEDINWQFSPAPPGPDSDGWP